MLAIILYPYTAMFRRRYRCEDARLTKFTPLTFWLPYGNPTLTCLDSKVWLPDAARGRADREGAAEMREVVDRSPTSRVEMKCIVVYR